MTKKEQIKKFIEQADFKSLWGKTTAIIKNSLGHTLKNRSKITINKEILQRLLRVLDNYNQKIKNIKKETHNEEQFTQFAHEAKHERIQTAQERIRIELLKFIEDPKNTEFFNTLDLAS